MMCFRDIIFCSRYYQKECINSNCVHAFTEHDRTLAIDWWGGDNFPLALGDRKTEVCGYIKGESNGNTK